MAIFFSDLKPSNSRGSMILFGIPKCQVCLAVNSSLMKPALLQLGACPKKWVWIISFYNIWKKLCFLYHPSSFGRNQFWPIPNYRLWLSQQKIMDCTRWAIVLDWFSIVSTKKGCPKSINKCECVCVWLWFWTLRIPAIIPFFRDRRIQRS